MSNSLASLGWQPFFQQQMSLDEWESAIPARVLEYHKSQYVVATTSAHLSLPINPSGPLFTVGDWVLLTPDRQFLRVLERKSGFRRKAAGTHIAEQLIASNVDIAFIVCSLNDDFNLNRIERYLSLSYDAGAEPVVVLSKADLCADPYSMRDEVQKLSGNLCVEMTSILDDSAVSSLIPWCQSGKTVVLLGSSGAGKSTLANALLGEQRQATGEVRNDDNKGRHTTTKRSLIFMSNGAILIDTPGMRELQLADCDEGVAATFADISVLARSCRFSDCVHESEPGCAVKQAVQSGLLDQRRLSNYRKLMREQSLNGASLAERRADDRKLSRYYSRVQQESKRLKRDS